jgi:hypothetical protein
MLLNKGSEPIGKFLEKNTLTKVKGGDYGDPYSAVI